MTSAAIILRESLEHEKNGCLALYQEILKLVEGHSVFFEEYARQMDFQEETHIGAVEKMLRKPASLPYKLFSNQFIDPGIFGSSARDEPRSEKMD